MAQPDLIITPFGENAAPGTIEPIPETLGPGDLPQQASWNAGFPAVTMTPLAAGGIPPRGQDFNGVLKAISEHTVFVGGGGQYKWDAAFAAAVGYPLGAQVQKVFNDGFWLNLLEGNTTDPDAGGSDWIDASNTTLPYALDTGAANAYVATYAPALSALTTGQVVRFKASNANTGASTFNPNGLGAKPIVSLTGSELSADAITANGHAWLQYDAAIGGGSWVLLIGGSVVPSNILTSGIQGSSSNLKASATGLSALVTVTADSLCLKNSANEQIVLNAVSVTPSLAENGANGLDTGTSTASTWYSVWVIWNGTTTAGLLSLSTTSPALPVGYTHKARVGWVRSDGTANKYPLSYIQLGDDVQFVISPGSNVASGRLMASGTAGNVNTPTYVAVAVGAFVPATASMISVNVSAQSSLEALVAPNPNYGAKFSQTTPAFYGSGNGGGNASNIRLLLESTNIYWASTGAALICMGYKDRL